MSAKKIETVMLPLPMGKMVATRMAPLLSHYWDAHGRVSLDDLVRSAYLQGVSDCAQMDIPRVQVGEHKREARGVAERATWAVY